MNYVNFTPIIDVSSIIWDKDKFDADKYSYHDLKTKVTTLFEILDNQKIKFLLRDELINEIRGGFPINDVSNDFYDFYGLVQSFFSRIDFIQYPASADFLVQSKPNLKKVHFTDSTKDEIQHLITRIHNGDEINKIYLTFDMLWDGIYNELITLENDTNEIRHVRIISDDANELKKSLKKFELKFEHHDKHERTKGYYHIEGGKLVSPLSCYDSRINNTDIPQKLLDDATESNGFYFNFDPIYEVYIRFIKTRDNIYHAHDESDEENIPEKIILKYRKSVTRGRGIDGNGKWVGI